MYQKMYQKLYILFNSPIELDDLYLIKFLTKTKKDILSMYQNIWSLFNNPILLDDLFIVKFLTKTKNNILFIYYMIISDITVFYLIIVTVIKIILTLYSIHIYGLTSTYLNLVTYFFEIFVSNGFYFSLDGLDESFVLMDIEPVSY